MDAGIQELTLRTLGRVKKVEDFNQIVLKVVNGSPVHVSDIGTVEDGIEEPRSLARVDGKEAVVLEVRKQSGTNTLAVVEGSQGAVGGDQTLAAARFADSDRARPVGLYPQLV